MNLSPNPSNDPAHSKAEAPASSPPTELGIVIPQLVGPRLGIEEVIVLPPHDRAGAIELLNAIRTRLGKAREQLFAEPNLAGVSYCVGAMQGDSRVGGGGAGFVHFSGDLYALPASEVSPEYLEMNGLTAADLTQCKTLRDVDILILVRRGEKLIDWICDHLPERGLGSPLELRIECSGTLESVSETTITML